MLISGCSTTPPDPNAPVYENKYVAVSNPKVETAELALLICEPEGEIAYEKGMKAYEAENSSLYTSCKKTYGNKVECTTERRMAGGFSAGMAKSDRGWRYKQKVLAQCMALNGYIMRRVCKKNCDKED